MVINEEAVPSIYQCAEDCQRACNCAYLGHTVFPVCWPNWKVLVLIRGDGTFLPRHIGWSRSQLPQGFCPGPTFSNSVLEKYNVVALGTADDGGNYLVCFAR